MILEVWEKVATALNSLSVLGLSGPLPPRKVLAALGMILTSDAT
jgi:hypothetical protein